MFERSWRRRDADIDRDPWPLLLQTRGGDAWVPLVANPHRDVDLRQIGETFTIVMQDDPRRAIGTVGGARAFSEERSLHGEPAVGIVDYIRSSRFWFESLQNWQSEFLAVFTIVVLSIVLRQRGSAQSKPIGW